MQKQISEVDMTQDQLVKELQKYAAYNYDAGGDWAYETFDKADYLKILAEAYMACGGCLVEDDRVLKAAKAALKAWCELINEREMDCSWDGPPEGYTRPVWEN